MGASKKSSRAKAPAKTASAARAEATRPSLRMPQRSGFARWFGVSALLSGVVLVIVLIASGGDDGNNTTVADVIPTITTAPTAPPAPAPPTAKPAVTTPAIKTPLAAAPAKAAPAAAAPSGGRKLQCAPIVGSGTLNGGKSYPVTSSASSGRPAGCGEAHSVLVSALSTGSTSIGGWSCKTDTSGDPIATCHSGGRTVLAQG
jgi:hypothetical protein